ncbi:hypothetical protein KKA72_01165 [Patescibacteria group bacterium]|nr:hypothetical protein [Patescibacteria group bacterium]MBU1876941.1 hypothetical protein [Patescibacteria group bacterium]
MRFTLEKFLGGNIVMMMRRAGYVLIGDYREDAEMSFINTIGINKYPRFHIYLRIFPDSQMVAFNLHIDQRKSVFKNYPDHGADYKGEVVETEAERILTAIK